MIGRECSVCHRPTHSQARRCAEHAYVRTRARWRDDRKLREDWVKQYGLVCPGLAGRPPHAISSVQDLTVHHVWPLGKGGPQDGEKRVACRSCNSAAGSTYWPGDEG